MNTDTKYKMYNYEVSPTEKVWDNLVAALDESIADKKIAAKLLGTEILPAENNWNKIEASLVNSKSDKLTAEKLLAAEVLPPTKVWMKIKEELEVAEQDKGIKDKLSGIELIPAGNIWSKIEKQLDDEQWDAKIGKKIINVEVYPPADTWNNIKAELNEDVSVPAKVIQFGGWKKIAVAAALTGIIAIGAVIMFRNTSVKNDNGNTAIVQDKKSNGIIALPKETEIETPAIKTNENTTTALAAVDKKTAAPNNTKTAVLVKKKPFNESFEPSTIAVAAFTTNELNDNRSKPDDTKSRIHKAIRNANTAEPIAMNNEKRYYNLLDENGNIVRISRKLNAMECIIKNGLDIPFDKKEENKECNDKVKDWHDKMALSASVLSPLDLPSVLSANK
jgi:hypothetical protein